MQVCRNPRLVGALALLGVAGTSCAARRELLIDSDPPGALVRLDDTVVGTTPYRTAFDAYGTRRITLYHEGYRTVSAVEEVEPPWYGRFPFDVFSEIVFPFGWHDPHPYHFTLVPETGTVTRPDLEGVLKRAEALRLAEPTGPRPTVHPTLAPEKPAADPTKPAEQTPAADTPANLPPPEPVPQVPPTLEPK